MLVRAFTCNSAHMYQSLAVVSVFAGVHYEGSLRGGAKTHGARVLEFESHLHVGSTYVPHIHLPESLVHVAAARILLDDRQTDTLRAKRRQEAKKRVEPQKCRCDVTRLRTARSKISERYHR